MKNGECSGFTAGGIAAGIKKNGKKDLGMIVSEVPASVAAVFTKNLVQAAPVRLDRERVAGGRCQAIIVNSGNANCCTGEKGMADALAMSRIASDALGIDPSLVCVCSTGVIGAPMPMERIEAGTPRLAEALTPDGFADFAEAIMTTDLYPKTVRIEAALDGKPFSIIGIAKGAGMIQPNMATMLCFVCTDLAAAPERLQGPLSQATDKTFNRITVDGDTSTNDTILLLANGTSEAVLETEEHQRAFGAVLEDVLMQLAKMVVRDGEGATKLVEVRVKGASSDADAAKVAETVANSPLVKTALFGEDANWGRIIAAVGRAGVPLDPERIDIHFNDVLICENGMGRGPEAEAGATRVLKTPEFAITIDLKSGVGEGWMFTCDFSLDYIKINSDYRS